MQTKEDLYKKAISLWGESAQIGMMFEEMSELQKELCKFERGKGIKKNIIEELADVEIMLEQMKILFEVHETDFLVAKNLKLGRLKELIENE